MLALRRAAAASAAAPSPARALCAAAADAAAAMAAGRLVPDAAVLALARARVALPDAAAAGWVLDGVPRTRAQAAALGADARTAPRLVVELAPPRDAIVARVRARRVDPRTGAVYNLRSGPPPPRDPAVRARLVRRADDCEDVVQERMRVYEREMPAVWDAFREQGVPVVTLPVAADDGPAAVHARVAAAVGPCRRVVLAGRPGCGKGTQAALLHRRLGLVHVSTGDLLRAAAGHARARHVLHALHARARAPAARRAAAQGRAS